MRNRSLIPAGLLVGLCGSALAQTAPEKAQTPPLAAAPPDAALYIIAPRPGARLTSPITVQFGLRNMGVTQAGSSAKNAGHHHLLVDAKEQLVPGEAIPADKNHLHFGGGQTETRLDLSNGPHTLQLVLGDAQHRPFSSSVQSQKIQITIVSAQAARRKRHRLRRH